jgi:predicted Zn-dependent peptidase
MSVPSAGASMLEIGSPTRLKLASGAQLICAPLSHTHRAAVSLLVRSGSRFETEALSGIAHFHEHMLHRGTVSYPSAHALALAFETLGAELGAATYVDHTLLTVASPPENLSRVLKVLGEVVTAPVFTDIEIERGIVREEILESLSEHGEPIDADELVMGLAFPDHGLGRPIAGTLDTLASFDVPTLTRFHASAYRAENLVVSVSGAIDQSEVTDVVERAFAGLKPGTPLFDSAPPELGGPRFRHVQDTGSQTALRLAFRAPSEKDALEPATELLLRTLDDGMSTRLYHRVCDELGLAYDVSATYDAFADTGVLMLAGDAAPSSAERLLETLFEVIAGLQREGPSAEEIEKAKRRARWQMQSMMDDPLELSAFLGLGELTGIAKTPAERVQCLESVNLEAVAAAAKVVFRPTQLAVAAIGPLNAQRKKALERRVKAFGPS